jgi:dienelactone hydrolase
MMIHFNTEQYMETLFQHATREFAADKQLPDGNWQDWQSAFRKRLRELTGLERIAALTATLPLSPRSEGVTEFAGYTSEKLYITTEPGIEIPVYLLLPTKGTVPFPLVLTPHGHGRRGKEVYVGNYENADEELDNLSGERDIALQAVKEGYAVIAMDVRGFWEMGREEEYANGDNNSCADLQKRAMLFGRTLIGERVHDIARLIDYAATRSEIDTNRIAITGNSGGGTVSLFAAALDERISICVPGSYLNTFKDSILAVYHCPCNYVPGILELGEMYDIAGLIAPRPFLAVNGSKDPIFPIAAARESFGKLQAVYNNMGYADRCQFFAGEGGHRYYKEPVWPFIHKHMKEIKER